MKISIHIDLLTLPLVIMIPKEIVFHLLGDQNEIFFRKIININEFGFKQEASLWSFYRGNSQKSKKMLF